MSEGQRSITFWKTIKIAIASAVIAGSLWVGWDHAQGLVWRFGPALNGYEFWFTPFIVYIMIQLPAAFAALLVRLLIGHRMSPGARFVAYPLVSIVATLALGYFKGANFDFTIVTFLLIGLPKTAIYGLVFALFDRISLARDVRQSFA